MLFEFMRRALHHLYNSRKTQYHMAPDSGSPDSGQPDINSSADKALRELKDLLGDSSDLRTHSFRFGPDNACEGMLLFYDGMVDTKLITEAILRPITAWQPSKDQMPVKKNLAECLANEVLCAPDITVVKTINELGSGCLSGDTVLIADGCSAGLVISTKGWDKRSVTEPQSETVVRGPREGFTENLRTNTALIRRKIKNGQLHAEMISAGRKTRTSICIMYIDGVANPDVVSSVKERIKRLDVDSILESGYIEQYIEDAPFSPFATVGYSEKPDVIAARVLEGRVAIVVDGTPFVLTAPMLFIESFQTAEDYYARTLYASFMRILRYMAYIIAAFAPAIYVALTSFHQELIPTTLLFTIAKAREGTPFPVLLEMLIMVFSFEVLREGGIRLPRPVGQAISIVGALVMGEAAVSAGLVGAAVVITIAITAVCGFLVPMQTDSISLIRLIMIFLAAFAGFYGMAMGVLLMELHLSTLTSFGVPYFSGFAWTSNLQDSIIRMPLWSMIKRPRGVSKGDTTRRRFFIPPFRPYSDPEGTDAEGEDH